MKRIVIDARESGQSTGRYVDKLVEYLYKLKPDFEIIVLTKSSRMDYIKKIAPGFRVIKADIKEFTFAEQIELKKLIRSLGADLVHFPAVQQPIWYRGKVVTTMQDLTTCRFNNPTKNPLIFKSKQQIYKWVNKKVARKSTRLITPSRFVKDDVVDFTGVKADKISVTHEAVDDFDEPAKPIREFVGKSFIMFNGRPMPHKNLHRLIETFAILHKTHPDLLLMIAGKNNGYHDKYLEQAERLSVGKSVIITGWITDGQLKWAMSHAGVYVYPSLSEGFGLPPLEAMMNGAPVAASNFTCIPEVCGDAAYYFNPLDVDDMATKISEVLDDKDLQKDLIAKGKQQIKKYSWRRMAKQTLEVYQQSLQ